MRIYTCHLGKGVAFPLFPSNIAAYSSKTPKECAKHRPKNDPKLENQVTGVGTVHCVMNSAECTLCATGSAYLG